MQVQVTSTEVRKRALSALRSGRKASSYKMLQVLAVSNQLLLTWSSYMQLHAVTQWPCLFYVLNRDFLLGPYHGKVLGFEILEIYWKMLILEIFPWYLGSGSVCNR